MPYYFSWQGARSCKKKQTFNFSILSHVNPVFRQRREFIASHNSTNDVDTDITTSVWDEQDAVAQRDLSYRLATATSLEEALPICLDSALRSQMDSGGIYLSDPTSGALRLAYSRGLSPAFIEAVRFVPAQSDRARMVQAGQPLYLDYDQRSLPTQIEEPERMRMGAVLPLTYQGRVVGCFNLASHHYTVAEVLPAARMFLEGIAAQAGHVIVRLQTEAALRESEMRFRTIFFEDRAAKLLIDPQTGRIVDANQSASDFYGYPHDHLTQMHIQVNDTYGHPVGDEVLRWVALQCSILLPPGAVFGRIGGEEFAVILPGADEPRTVAALDVVRHHVARKPIPTRQGNVMVTISIGVAALDARRGVTLDQLLEYADQALYQAKRDGRNRICIASCFRDTDPQREYSSGLRADERPTDSIR